MNDLDEAMSSLARATDPFVAPSARLVRQADGTEGKNGNLHTEADQPFTGDEEAQVDGLFGDSVAYVKIKREKPQHRLMLWMTLNGHKPTEIAAALRVTPQTVRNVLGQAWFQEAFCRMSTERGKDAVETFLQGQVVPTLQKLVDLRDGKDVPAAVQKSACDAILDRIRGKPVAYTKSEVSGGLDIVHHDAEKLRQEYERNAQILASRGLGKN